MDTKIEKSGYKDLEDTGQIICDIKLKIKPNFYAGYINMHTLSGGVKQDELGPTSFNL